MKIKNGRVMRYSANRLSLEWEDAERNRYHTWLDEQTFEPRVESSFGRHANKVIIYKNPPIEIGVRDEGYFKTRYLDAGAASNAKILAAVKTMIDIPAEAKKATAEQEAADLEKAGERRKDYMRHCKEKAGEALYEALANLMPAARAAGLPLKSEQMVAAIAAIEKADADAHTMDIKAFI